VSVFYSPESAHAKEMAKWEQTRTAEVPNPVAWADGGRFPRTHQEYPKAMHLAGRNKSGVPEVQDTQIAETETMEANFRSRGFGSGPEEALKILHAKDQEAAVGAAERAYSDRKMSPAAQAEADAVDSHVARHLPELPAVPITKRVTRETR
jgi:hypothetical protein